MNSTASLPRARYGFSLVELSIVLVILGLLVGGVLSGQSLIHAAELRSVTSEFSRYVAATHTFKDKYFALPGDMTNATAFWGLAAGNGVDGACRDHVSTGTETCNGDGDGKLREWPAVYEDLRYWQQLANAGLIEGHYDGSWGTNSTTSLPTSKYDRSVWTVENDNGYAPATASFFGMDMGNYLMIGPASFTGAEDIVPVDAWNIDKKIDDGIPGTGSYITWKGTVAEPCTNLYGQVTDAGSQYNLSGTGKICRAYFQKAF